MVGNDVLASLKKIHAEHSSSIISLRETPILWMGVSPHLTTAYGKLSHYIVNGLRERGWNIFLFGLHTVGRRKEQPEWELPILKDAYGSDILAYYLKKHKIKLLVTAMDAWNPHFAHIAKTCQESGVQWIAQATINSEKLPRAMLNHIAQVNWIVSPSAWGKEVVKKHGFANVTYIPHGVNHDVFKLPNDGMYENGYKWHYKEVLQYKNKFVFVAVGKNKNHQKYWYGLLDAYSRFLKKYPELRDKVALHCHTEFHLEEGFSLGEVANRFELGNDVLSFPNDLVGGDWGYSEESMASFLQAFDCYVTFSLGESFNMPMVEAMACGLPAIVPNHSALGWHAQESAACIFIPIKHTIVDGELGEMYFTDEDRFADAMHQMMTNHAMRDDLAKNAVGYAKKFTWQAAVDGWEALLVERLEPKLSYPRGDIGV